MLTTVKGYYRNGQIILEEKPLVSDKAEVLVTFLTDEMEPNKKSKRILGTLKGKITIPENFNQSVSFDNF